jgi:exosortase A-associated hydrolase 2
MSERTPVHEEYQFLNLNGERIFAAHYRSAQHTSRAVVMCHPMGEEKLWAHRVFVSFARDLASIGFDVLRFDFRGEGDSDRAFEHADFETRIGDTCLAVDTVRELNPAATEVTLLGLRLGASVAAAAAARRSDVARLILWDPVVDGAAYMQTVLRANLMFQMALHRKVIENRDALVARLARRESVNIDGYELTEPLYQQVSGFHLADVLMQFSGMTLIVQVNQGEAQVKPELANLAETNDRCRVEAVQEEPFWREIKTFYQRASELTRVSLQALEAVP